MSQLYAVRIKFDMPNQLFEKLLVKVSQERQKQIKKFAFRADAFRSLFAELLLRRILRNEYGISNNQIQFEYNSFGKPFVKGIQSFYFNLSHSGRWVVCAIDYRPVGVDIEQIKLIDLQIAHRFFSKLENQDFNKRDAKDKLDYFYEIWVLKESYIKMIGKGLHLPLDSFSCRVMEDRIVFHTLNEHPPVYFKKYDIDQDYKLAVCKNDSYFPEHIYHVSLESMIQDEIFV